MRYKIRTHLAIELDVTADNEDQALEQVQVQIETLLKQMRWDYTDQPTVWAYNVDLAENIV